MNNNGFSIIFPDKNKSGYKQMSDTAFHDLGLDALCKILTADAYERNYIKTVLSNMTADVYTANYRKEVFADILRLPDLRYGLTELFEKLDFMRNFGTMSRKTDEKPGIWYLMHRLDEFSDYIKCVESMRILLKNSDIHSEGLLLFGKYIDDIYEDSYFAQMKKDIDELKTKTSDIKSVTIGINLNERFDAVSMGLISVNSKPFRKSGIVGNFADAAASRNGIREDNEWNGEMRYHEVDSDKLRSFSAAAEKNAGLMTIQKTPFASPKTTAGIPADDSVSGSAFYLENVLNKMLAAIVKKLSGTLAKYADTAVINISGLIPEFTYYIRFAEFIEKYIGAGFSFCEANAVPDDERSVKAEDFYNLKLAVSVQSADEIVCNDLEFDREHTVYILTGANRGGKTTATQAVGLLFALAQGGINVPAKKFEYSPADCIFTHFPADEDKTTDLGRLGEECVRFREIYRNCTADSLLLLNESFSTTSFEEGFYIARDAVKAVLKKETRTIFNTHMHKLAADISDINKISDGAKAASLTAVSENGERSFRLRAGSPEGKSYAKDIAEKYGMTYEMLTG